MSHTSRRKFAKSLAAAGAALPLAALAQTPPAAPAPPAPSESADALVALTRAQFGPHLDAAELEQMRKGFAESAAALARYRAFPLANADEPDLTFVAGVERW